MKVQFLKPNIAERDIKNIVRVLRSGWLAPGRYTRELEENFARYLGVKYAVMNSSCTAALHMALILAGVKEGDEVITTPISYVATSNVILYQNAKPVFVDVDSTTGLINLNEIEKKITKKTKAIIPVHLYGQMVDMRKLRKIADRHKLAIIEDASHAIESQRDGMKPGQISFAACFSFHTAKNMTSGQGGMFVTNSLRDFRIAKMLRRDGVVNIDAKRQMFVLGYKYDSTDFQAAMLVSQLDRIENQLKIRGRLFKKYAAAFEKIDIKFPRTLPDVKHACHMFIIWVDPKKRDRIREYLEKSGIQTSIHYDPIHLEPYYKKTFGYKKGDFPIAERLGFSTITLPLYPGLTIREQDYVIKKVVESVKKA